MFGPGASTQKVTRAVTGIIPLVLAGCVIYSTYIVIAKICFDYFITQGWHAAAYAVTVLAAVLLLLMALSYMRLYLMIQTNPGLVPLPPPKSRSASAGSAAGGYDVTAVATRPGQPNAVGEPEVQLNEMPGLRHDSPGLEAFYGMEAFVCDGYGHPRFCTHCHTWKPDRAHHSAEIGRCVRKMDHFCPWVGGMVGETSFKFFTQFVFYAALFCFLSLAASAVTLAGQLRRDGGVDAEVCVVVGLAGFFGLFSFLMTATAARFILLNTTNVDHIDHSSKVYRIALSIRAEDAWRGAVFAPIVTYPLHRDAFRPAWAARHVGPDDETDEERDQRHAREDDAVAREQQQQQQKLRGSLGGEDGVGKEAAAATSTTTTTTTTTKGGDQPGTTKPPAAAESDPARKRHFAVVLTRPGENPWDRGYAANFRAVMGDGPVDWLLPVRQSPCVSEWSNEGFYRFGPLIETLRARHGIRRPGEELSEKAPLL